MSGGPAHTRHSPPPPHTHAPPPCFCASANGVNRALKPQALLDVHAEHKVEMRTDLIRQKAAMRAAGVEPWDPTVLQMRSSVPAIASTVTKSSAGAIDVGRVATGSSMPMSATCLGTAAAFRAIEAPPSDTNKFARNGSFSSTWRVKPRA